MLKNLVTQLFRQLKILQSVIELMLGHGKLTVIYDKPFLRDMEFLGEAIYYVN